jgi:hypothetical protein
MSTLVEKVKLLLHQFRPTVINTIAVADKIFAELVHIKIKEMRRTIDELMDDDTMALIERIDEEAEAYNKDEDEPFSSLYCFSELFLQVYLFCVTSKVQSVAPEVDLEGRLGKSMEWQAALKKSVNPTAKRRRGESIGGRRASKPKNEEDAKDGKRSASPSKPASPTKKKDDKEYEDEEAEVPVHDLMGDMVE